MVSTTLTNKPINPRGNDQSPKGYNRAALYSGKALDFDGVNDYVDCGTLDVTAYTAISMSFNLKLANVSDTDRILSLKHTGIDDIRFLQVSNTLLYTLDDGTSYNLTSPELTANEWFKIDMTFNGTTLKGYLNGVEFGSIAASFDFSTADGLLYLFRHTEAAAYAEGAMAGFKIFNTALTAAQVADLYNNPEKVVPTGVDNTALKLWLPMQEGAGTTAYDGSGNGNHGTISGATYVHGIGAPVSQTAVIDWNKGENYIDYSNDFSESSWTKVGTTLTSGQSDPFGGNDAWQIDFAAGANNYIFNKNLGTGNKTNSIWLKADSAIELGLHNGLSGDQVTLTTSWVRYSVTQTSTNSIAGLQLDNYAGLSTPQLALTFYAYQAQNEEGSTAGPLVPTIGTAQTAPVLLPQGLTSGRDITGVNLFENVRKQGALNLDGNSWAEVHDNESLDITDAITLEAWVYWGDGSNKGILGRWVPNENKASYLLYKLNDYNVSFYISSDGTVTNLDLVPFNVAVSDGWQHIVGIYDGSSLKSYLNGSLTNTVATSLTEINANDKKIEIGRYNESSSFLYSNAIAQPRIYNRALTAEEVQRSYDSGKNIFTNS